MQLSLTTDYALRMIHYLSAKKTIVPSSEISENLNIPQQYVQSIGRKLKKAGYVNIMLGTAGGLSLIKKPAEISIYDIVLLMENSIKINRCLADEKLCNRAASSYCVIHAYFAGLQSLVEQDMQSVTFADFLKKKVTPKLYLTLPSY